MESSEQLLRRKISIQEEEMVILRMMMDTQRVQIENSNRIISQQKKLIDKYQSLSDRLIEELEENARRQG